MKRTDDFFDFCVLCEKESQMEGRKGASMNYMKARQKVGTYLSGESLGLGDIDEAWVRGFNDWLVGLGHEKSSISFYNRVLRAVYNKAVKKHIVKNVHPFDNAYTEVIVTHYPVRMSEDEERVSFEELSRDELLRRYKSLAYKYNNIVHRLREIMPV